MVDEGGQLFGLSNNHVTGGSNYAVPTLPIVAPGMADVTAGGRDPITIGHHYAAQPFIDGLPDIVDASANLDAAIFAVSVPDALSSMQRNSYDTPTTCIPLAAGMDVEKVGRTSGRTTGKVIAEFYGFEPIMYLMDIIGGKKAIWFKSLFAIRGTVQNFSWAGDSGSLITALDEKGERVAVGIVVGGTDEGLTLALSLDRILDHFKVKLVGGHNV